MQMEELVSAVRQTTGLDHEQAVRAIHATVRVLGTRLAGGQTGNLGSQLPADLAEELPAEGPGERIDVEEFYRRVAEAEGGDCTEQQARQHARATLAAFKVALSGREFDHVAAQLPPDYADLLTTEPVQH
jgi:uncharacterized protein (DUF2267 family)